MRAGDGRGVLRGGLFAGLIKGCGLRCGVGLRSGKDIGKRMENERGVLGRGFMGEKGGRLWKMRRGSGWPC